MKTGAVDLHMHSWFSDGSDSPSDLVVKAKEAGLKVACLSDHDSVAGVAEFLAKAKEIGLEATASVECSTVFEGLETHIAGFNINPDDPELNQMFDNTNRMRATRADEIIGNIAGLLGLEGASNQELMKITECRSVFAFTYWMLEYFKVRFGIPFEKSKELTRYNGPAYIHYDESCLLDPFKLIERITATKGVAILNHPGELMQRASARGECGGCFIERVIHELKQAGLVGLEVYSPKHSQDEIDNFLSLARVHDLVPTAGSDYHGRFTTKIELGSYTMDYEDYLKLKRLGSLE